MLMWLPALSLLTPSHPLTRLQLLLHEHCVLDVIITTLKEGRRVEGQVLKRA
jgi:hypothetical protein